MLCWIIPNGGATDRASAVQTLISVISHISTIIIIKRLFIKSHTGGVSIINRTGKRMGFSNSKLFALNECDARYPGLLNRALDRGAPVINHVYLRGADAIAMIKPSNCDTLRVFT